MLIEDLKNILTQYRFSPMHDYDDKETYISMLGIFEEDIKYLRKSIPDDWELIEKRKNPDNGFCRIDIIPKK